mgnify:CR=1 FL=1
MTDRFALDVRCAARTSGARSRTRSVEAVSRRPTSSRVVEERDARCARSGGALHGPLPVPRGADAELLGQPGRRARTTASAAARAATRSRSSARREGLDFVGAIEWLGRPLPRPARVRGERRRAQDARRKRRERLCDAARPGGDVLRALPVGLAGRRARARLPRRRAASARRSAASSGSGSRSGGNDARAQGAREGLHGRRAARPPGLITPARRRLLPAPARSSRSPTRAAGCVGFQARQAPRGRPAARRSTSTRPRVELFHKGVAALRARQRARRDREARTAPCVVEGNTDVIALRQAGFEPVVASMGTALTAQAASRAFAPDHGASVPLLRQRRGRARTRRCAAWRRRAAAGFDVKVVALPHDGSGRRSPGGIRGSGSPRPTRTRFYRVRTEIRRAPDAQAAYERAREVPNRVPDSPERHEALRATQNDKLGMTIQLQRGVATTAVGEEISPRLLEAAERLGGMRSRGSRHTRASARCSREPHSGALRPRSYTGGLGPTCSTKTKSPTRISSRCWPSSMRVPPQVWIDEDTARELLLRPHERQLRRASLCRCRPRGARSGAPAGAAREDPRNRGQPGSGLPPVGALPPRSPRRYPPSEIGNEVARVSRLGQRRFRQKGGSSCHVALAAGHSARHLRGCRRSGDQQLHLAGSGARAGGRRAGNDASEPRPLARDPGVAGAAFSS